MATPSSRRSSTTGSLDAPADANAAHGQQLSLLPAVLMLRMSTRAPDQCDICSRGKGCPACTQRRRRAERLRDKDGLAVPQIAERMGISEARVDALLEQARIRGELAESRLPSRVPNEQLRAAFELRKRQDAAFSAATLARRVSASGSAEVLRDLGLLPLTAKEVNGYRYPGRTKATVSWRTAERLLRGLGCDPREVELLASGERLSALN